MRPGEVDADRFERLADEGRTALQAGDTQRAADYLRSALALWHGRALADVEGLDLAAREAARLEDARLDALELRVETDLELGAQVVGELTQLAAAHPLRERLHELLMLALYRDARQAEALEAYQLARAALVEQLGIEPGPALRELHAAILRQDPRLDRPPEPRDAIPAPAFVGREQELATLKRSLDDVMSGHGRLVLIGGEPGIGKSRLIEELTAHARGARVLVGRCWEAGGAPAYWPWVQSLRALAAAGERLTAPEVGAGELAELVPELRRHFPAVATLNSEGARFRVYEAVADLLRTTAHECPIVLAIDDLHAGDAPSLLLLQFVARNLRSMRVLLLCAYRDVDPVPGSALVETLAALAREPGTARLALGPLSEADVVRYVALTAAELSSPDTIAALHAETDGNPLFLGETVRLMATEGRLAVPQSVRDVVSRRVGHLSPECGAVLTLASVLGREFDIAPLTLLAEGDVLDVLDEALAARVLADVPGAPGRLRFAHMVIRDTLYEQLTSVRRVQMHARALAALEASDGDPAELAHHATGARDDAKHALYARRAGDHAMSVLAYEEAARHYHGALETVRDRQPRCELMLALGNAEIRSGDTAAGKRAFLEAADLARDPRDLARAAYGYGGRNVYARAGGDPHMIPLLERALDALGDEDPELRVLMLARLAGALRDQHSRERRDRISYEAVDLARRATGPATLAYALEARVAALTGPDTIEECLALGRQMEQAAIRSGDAEQIAAAHTHQIAVELIGGDLASATRRVEDALRTAGTLRQPARMWVAAAMHAVVELAVGHLEAAEALIEEALAIGERAQPDMAVPAYHQQRYGLLELTGSLTDAEAGIAQLVSASPRRSFRCFLAHAYAATERRDEAAREIQILTREGLPLDASWPLAVSMLAEACAWLDDADSATLLYAQIHPWRHLVAADATDGYRGAMSRYVGQLATTLDRFDDAETHFVDAAAANKCMGAHPWHAFTLHDHGRMLLRRGDTGARARELIDAAHDQCGRLGIVPPTSDRRRAR